MVWAGTAIASICYVLLVIILAAAETVRIYWIDDEVDGEGGVGATQVSRADYVRAARLHLPTGGAVLRLHRSCYDAMAKPPRPWLHTWSSSYSDVCETAT